MTEKARSTRKIMFSLHVSNQIVSKYIKTKTVRTTGSLLEGNSGRLQHTSLLMNARSNKIKTSLNNTIAKPDLTDTHITTREYRLFVSM